MEAIFIYKSRKNINALKKLVKRIQKDYYNYLCECCSSPELREIEPDGIEYITHSGKGRYVFLFSYDKNYATVYFEGYRNSFYKGTSAFSTFELLKIADDIYCNSSIERFVLIRCYEKSFFLKKMPFYKEGINLSIEYFDISIPVVKNEDFKKIYHKIYEEENVNMGLCGVINLKLKDKKKKRVVKK
jgi:hypothetical protein